MASAFIGVTGLPRAGSTLLCQLLAQHSDIHCEGHSSPLCNTLLGMRRMVSDDQFFLAQLDNSFENSYAHLASAMQGYLRSWCHSTDKAAVVDKNPAWLHAQPLACMSHVYAWLNLAPHQINPKQLSIGISESHSHYHMKYPHRQASEIKPPQRHAIPPRIEAQIASAYAWFYQSYYSQC